MKELRAVISDEEFATLDHLVQDLGGSLEELMKRNLAAYMAQAKAEPIFEPIGFGMVGRSTRDARRGEVGGRITAPGMDLMMALDTDVFIDHFRGQEAATAYIHNLPVDPRATTTSLSWNGRLVGCTGLPL